MKKIIKNIIFNLILFMGGINLVGMTANVVRNRTVFREYANTKYKTWQEFETDLKIEQKELGLEKKIINLGLDNFVESSKCEKAWGGSYDVIFNLKYQTPFVLRHELYHIKKMVDSEKGLQKYLRIITIPVSNQIEEWQATSYAIKRAKEEAQEEGK